MAVASEEQRQVELKRLAAVPAAASSAAALASRLYTTSKTYVPERLQGTVEAAESRVVAAASPFVPALLDKSTSALAAVDQKVDGAITSAWHSYSANTEYLASAVAAQRQRVGALAAPGLEQFAEARRAYLRRVEDSVAYVQEQGLTGTTKAAADALLAKVEDAKKVPTVVLHEISDAWAKFAHSPAVERLLAASKGQVEAAYSRYMAAHDAVVANPRYSAAYEAALSRGGAVLQTLQASTAYQAAAGRLAPLLAPVAEKAQPLVQPYVQALSAHLAPVPASA